VLFGALGDLAWRLVGPALYDLFRKRKLPENFQLIGVDHTIDTGLLVTRLRDAATRFSKAGAFNAAEWDRFAACIRGHSMDLNDQTAYPALKDLLHAPDRDRRRTRFVVEKPLGRDLESFRVINETLADRFHEQQIFRMDHFLGKETVQNILALRFANPIFEPIWNRRYIDHVAITVAETLMPGYKP
jgi:glucose-6-phosphate 1-dehydrogenase